MKQQWRIAITIAAMGLFLPGSVGAQGEAGKPPEVSVTPVESRVVPVVQEYTGTIEAVDTVEVRARVEGFLDERFFQEGTYVKKGDPLFQIDPREYEAAVMQAKASLAKAEADLASARAGTEVAKAEADLVRAEAEYVNAQKDLARIKPLAEADAVSVQELDSAVATEKASGAMVESARALLEQAKVNRKANIDVAAAQVQMARAELAKQELNLGYTRIVAPLDGRIGKSEQNVGVLVGRGENSLLATISAFDPSKVNFSISESELLRYARRETANGSPDQLRYQPIPSLKFQIVLADGTLYEHEGTLDFVDRAVDTQTGTMKARARFPNPKELLRPGMFAKLRITDARTTASVIVPQRAIVEQQGGQYVLVVDAQNKVERRKVVTGARVDSMIAINEGLAAGERVIVEGTQLARPGMPVRVKP